MKDKLKKLEDHVTALANDPGFIHHQWFVTHHLKIIEQLVQQIFVFYPDADQDVVMAMVWLHDLGKMMTNQKTGRVSETEVTLTEGRKLLDQFGFPAVFSDKVIADLTIFEQAKIRDLSKENIEVQITSTADGCSHFAMPFFFASYWHDNPQASFDALVTENARKSRYDWERKITLPEARQAFEQQIRYIMDYNPADIGQVFKG